jgi:copper chaperone
MIIEPMKTFLFKTNINCNGCIAKVTPTLNQLQGILKWEVDTANPSKILSVETETLSESDIMAALKTAGYKADLI